MVCERRNQKSKSFKYSSKIVFYISNKIIVLFEVWKKTKGKNPRAAKTNKENQFFYQNVRSVAVKN